MARAGEKIYNPVQNDWIVFKETAQDTSGALMRGELVVSVTLTGVNKGEIYLARPPVPVQKAFLAALAPVGRLLGYKDHYPKYSAAEAPGAEVAGRPPLKRWQRSCLTCELNRCLSRHQKEH